MGIEMSTPEENKVLSQLRHARIVPIVEEAVRKFDLKYGEPPTEIGINAKCMAAFDAELDNRTVKLEETGGPRWRYLSYKGNLIPMIAFMPTTSQLKQRPDMEWLFLRNSKLNVVETL